MPEFASYQMTSAGLKQKFDGRADPRTTETGKEEGAGSSGSQET